MTESPQRDTDDSPEYGDEVLDASWLPRPEGPLKVIRSAARDEGHPPVADEEAEAFLDAIYRNQE